MRSKVSWPKKALESLKTSGRVDLEGEDIDDLGRLGQLQTLRTLNLSYCQITSISGLKPLPKLETFIADGSPIVTFRNFAAIENIHRLSLRNTPLSRTPQFALSAVVVCPRLASLNGKQIADRTRRRAEALPPLVRRLVNAGWLAEFPCPPGDHLADIAAEFGVVDEDPQPKSAPAPPATENFEECLKRLEERHVQLVRRARQQCDLPIDGPLSDSVAADEEKVGDNKKVESVSAATETLIEDDVERDNTPRPLIERLSGLLRRNDVEVDDADPQRSVLAAIERLCSQAGAHDKATPRKDAAHQEEEEEEAA
jgi:hypothetical protein